MNRDDIIRMAREVCHPDTVDAWHNGFWTLMQDELERFAALVAAGEREACARLCENERDDWGGDTEGAIAARDCANAIRARGE